MSIHFGGKKWTDIVLNGRSWSKAYLNGHLIFSKGSPSPTSNFATLWWDDGNGNITEESIDTLSDWNALYSSTIMLSNGHYFNRTQIVDFQFGNSSSIPSTINDYFGSSWTGLDIGSQSGITTLKIPDSVTQINDFFFEGSSINATDIDMNNVTLVQDYFLANTPFNGTLSNATGINTIGNSFLESCLSFNQNININPTTIGNNFMKVSVNDTNAMHGNVNLGTRLTSIGNSFLSGFAGNKRNVFDGTLTIPNTLTSIGDDFMSFCDYNGSYNFYNSSLTSIGNNFNLNGKCSSVTLPINNPLSIDSGFLYQHETTVGILTIPSNVTYVGSEFCFSGLTSRYIPSSLVVEADPINWANDTSELTLSYAKLQDTERISVTGTYASQFKAKYPESASTVTYDVARYYA